MKTIKIYLKQNKKFLIILLCFSFLIRAILFQFFLSKNENYWTADSQPYNEVAVQIAQGNGIVIENQVASFYRLPGYPAILSVGYKLFNFDIKKTLWLQIFFACLIPILIFCLSLALFPQNILLARVSSIYSAIHLGFVVFSGLLMSETFFVLFFLLFCLLFFSSFNLFFCSEVLTKNKTLNFFGAGLFLGLASLIRPVGHYVIFVSILLILFSSFKFKVKIRNSVLLFFGWLLIVFGWLLRNYILTSCIFFHTLPGKHFLNNSASYVVMHSQNVSYQKAKEKLSVELNNLIYKEETRKSEKLNESQQSDVAQKLSFKYMKQYPFLTLKHSLINIFKTTFYPFGEELLFIEGKKDCIKNFLFPKLSSKWLNIFLYLELFLSFFIWVGFFAFIFKSLFNLNNLCVLLKVVPFIKLFIFLTLASGFARLRLPIEPLIFILALNFWLQFFKKKTKCQLP